MKKVISKIHKKIKVFRMEEFDGKHRDICPCHHDCKLFHPDTDDNCPIAAMAYNLSKMTGIVLVHSCKHYK